MLEEVNSNLLNCFFPPNQASINIAPPLNHNFGPLLTGAEVTKVLTQLSDSSAPGPNRITYSI